ncbi:hypothetical protein B0T18DRAFT_59464 [Schizothecium vesticola]|uniref:Uncharacterized protein n=1 Tax=Schizothecium vesticola TaxID=314040 RepID=A0AA40F4P3_9PEZI|nr:hypothetical protein B0T18DRAFT_59464 [Schizothecium vesticola]
MEEITREVTQLQGDLHTSRSQLRMLKSTSKTDITNKIDAIRPPLASAQRPIGNICSDNASFVARIEAGTASTDPNSMPSPDVLAEVPQKLVTLRADLDNIVGRLVAAHEATATAINTTDAWGLQVMDVGQEVDVKSTELARCQTGAALLAEQARKDLAESRAALRSAESELRRKRADVRNKEREVEGKRELKTQLTKQVEEKNRQVAAAERERGERKGQAAVSGIAGASLSSWLPLHLAQVLSLRYPPLRRQAIRWAAPATSPPRPPPYAPKRRLSMLPWLSRSERSPVSNRNARHSNG